MQVSRRKVLLVAAFTLALVSTWLYWNRPRRAEMATYVPADCLAFVEVDDLVEVAGGIGSSEAWTQLAAPLGARSSLLSNRWFIRLARWTGIGSADAVLLARSQLAVVFTGSEASQADTTLTIKPLTTLVIETHTSQRRMRSVLENHIEEFARSRYGQPTLVRKQIDGVDLVEWSTSNGSGLVTAFVDTMAIVGNDEASVIHCVNVRRGRLPSLGGDQQLEHLRKQVGAASLFGFLAKAGVKPVLTAWVLSRGGSDPNAPIAARIFADTFGNLVEGFACGSRFADGGVEDRCFLSVSEGVADTLRGTLVPDTRADPTDMAFVPANTESISVYRFRDVEGLWRDLNAVVSSHADALGAIASRPFLRSLLKPYGIDDPDTFVRSVGTRLETIRLEENAPSVLVADAFDRPSLRKLAQQRLGPTAKTETAGDAELMLSSSDNLAVCFTDNRSLTGTADAIRRCLQAKVQSKSLASVDAYRRSQRLIDTSLPIIVLTFTDQRRTAISFVELFSTTERSAFSTNASTIDEASRSLPYAVSVTMLRENGFEWSSRSAFGMFGSLALGLAPEKPR